jgi:radical SAM protein with 4Fe4S-binding SPASM domain
MRAERGFIQSDTLERILEILPTSVDRLWLMKQGESLLHSDFPKLLNIIKDRRPELRLMLATNASPLTLKNCEAIIQHVEYLDLGLHSIDKETYAKITGRDLFDRVIDNIKTLDQLLDKNNTSLKYNITYVRQPVNRHQSNEEVFNFFKSIFHNANRIVIKWESNFGGEIGEANFNATTTLPYQQFPKCPLPYTSFSVCYDGNVSYCCAESKEEIFVGNVHHNSFEEIWNGQTMQLFRKNLATGNYPALNNDGYQCQHCVWPWSLEVMNPQLFVSHEYKALLEQKIAQPFLIEHFMINGFIDFLNADLEKALYHFTCAESIITDKKEMHRKAEVWRDHVQKAISRLYGNIEQIERELNKEDCSIGDMTRQIEYS